ncbi:MAG: hypothetical protein ACI9HK_000063 [Pirellulaceae bacterium]
MCRKFPEKGEFEMKTKLGLCLFASVVLIAGCVPSLNPVYTSEQLVVDENLVGEFVDAKSKIQWGFTKGDGKSYRLVYTDKSGKQGKFIAHLADLGGVRVLDLFPEQEESAASRFYQVHIVPIHTFFLVVETKPNLILATLDFNWLDGYVKHHPDEIDIATFETRKMITSPTKDVQEFIVKHKGRFVNELSLERQAE